MVNVKSKFDIKAYLGNIKRYDLIIKTKTKQLKELDEMYNAIGCNNISGTYSNTNIVSDKVSNHIIKKSDLINDIKNTIIEYTLKKNVIIEDINKLDDSRLIDVLIKRYVDLLSLEKIAVELNYNYDYVRQLHNKALNKLNCILTGKDISYVKKDIQYSNDETMRRIQRGEGLESISQQEKSKGICHERRV